MFYRQAISAARNSHLDLGPRGGPAVPAGACCCLARPLVKVMMPATRGRPHRVDLWLCGHRYRASREPLAAAGAQVHWLSEPDNEPLGTMSGASHVPPR